MKFFLTFLTLILTLLANEYNFLRYSQNFKISLNQAATEKKLLMLLVVQDNCKWCKDFAFNVLSQTIISKKIGENFIPLVMNKDTRTLPVKYHTRLTPTIYFINPLENEEVWRSVGYRTKEELMQTFDKALISLEEDLSDEEK